MKRLTTLLFLTVLFFRLPAQERPMYAAGRFYESDSAKLVKDLSYLFSKTASKHLGTVLALISPHAGYAYSGEVAAVSMSQIDPGHKYDNIFLIGSSHTMYLNGASVWAGDAYRTPLGKVTVNRELAKRLIKENPYISFVPEAHLHEHSLENQIPFLQYRLKKPFKIVPLIIGTENEKILKSLAQTLKPYFGKNNLFIISSDFSHYPRYRDAQHADSTTAKAVCKNSVHAFKKALRENAAAHYPGLVTSACGHTSIETLLYITQQMSTVSVVPLKYMNSGDAEIGDKQRVVGYFSIAFVKKDNKELLTREDKEKLLQIARKTLETYLQKGVYPEVDTAGFSAGLKMKSGAFVTLNEKGALRGCIGRFVTREPLYKTVQEMAVAAATQDYRFPPVTYGELKDIDIEISVLTPLKKIENIDEIVLGRDGIYIQKGNRHGTFLPQVATETGWSREEFLGHCARDKAGLSWDGWKDADIFTYRAIVFSENKH